MITIEYELDIDMETETRTYHPPKEISEGLKNIFKLRGPNSSGKSTFMNVVALGSYGLYKGKVPDSIRERMKDLIESEYKNLEFKLVIHDPVTGRILKSEKKKKYPDIKVSESRDGGKTFEIIIAERFEKEYNLIYDIPENPVGRLKELVDEISEIQKRSIGKIRDLQRFTEDVSKTISGSRSDAEIVNMKRQLDELKNQFDEFDIGREEVYVKALEGLMIATRLKELKFKSDEAKSAYDKSKKHAGLKEKEDSKNDHKEQMALLNTKIKELLISKLPLTTNANRIKYPRYDKLKELMEKMDSDPNTYIQQKDILKEIKGGIQDVKLYAEAIKSSDDDGELRVITELINTLKPYLYKNLVLPEIGSLDKLHEILTKRFDSMSESYDIKTVNDAVVYAETFMKKIDEINEVVSKITPVREDIHDTIDESIRVENLRNAYEMANNNVVFYVKNVSSLENITLANVEEKISEFNLLTKKEFENKKYDDIKEAHSSASKLFKDDKERKDHLWHNITRLENSIKMESSKEKSEFLDRKRDIDILKDEINDLLLKMSDSNRKLDIVKTKNYGPYGKDDPFFKSVWRYLGKRLRTIRHEDREYSVSEVNLIETLIVAEDGTKIRLTDMGTGQSQLSYLKGLLSADDNRMIIALFDEVSTMTDSTLDVLLEELQILQEKGKLMLGMTVSPSEKIEVDEYGI